MHQTLDFYTGNKRYKLRNGIKIKIKSREIINGVPRYYAVDELNNCFVFFANGNCASGYDYDLVEALTGIKWEKE